MNTTTDRVGRYPIRAVSKMTGIAIDTLRAWERRYGAVSPSRDERGRLYSDADVARLRLIGQAVTAGHSVGRVAALDEAELHELVATSRQAASAARPATDAAAFGAALARFDTVAVDTELSRLAAVLPPLELIRDVLMPVLREVGDEWNSRPAGIAQEHLMSATMRGLLGSFLRLHSRREAAVRLTFATPAGDQHEIGILGAAMLAAVGGLGVSYLGADLPAQEIVAAVDAAGARVLVLGLTLTLPDRHADRELRALVRDLPAAVELWAGGPAAHGRADVLGHRGLVIPDFDTYVQQLERLGGRVT